MKTTACTPLAALPGGHLALHPSDRGERRASSAERTSRTARTWRGWLAAGLLACTAGAATANDDEPGLANFAQLTAISVGGVAAILPNPERLEDNPLHVALPPIDIGHCAPQVITVTAWQPNDWRHVVNALGQTLYLDGANRTQSLNAAPLAFGTNLVDINVARPGNDWPRVTYSLTIERAGPGTNPDLAGIALSSGTLSPPFDPAITSYSATVNTPSVAVVPTAADCPALTVNGQPVASGGAAQVPLALGPNTVTVRSTAQDGTERTFTLALTRTPSPEAALQSLSLSAGALSPAFDSAITHYTASVPYLPSVSVTAAPTVPSATLSINGAPAPAGAPQTVALQVGTTAITVGVTSEDGSATRSYTVDVARAPPSANANLSALTLSAGALDPAFDPAVAAYTAAVANAVDAIDVRPTVALGATTVSVNGTPVASGGAVRVPLVPGFNTITVQSTAQDGSTQQTYTVRVLRASAANSAQLLGLQLSSGAPWPPVQPATLAYTARVASTTAAITLTPTVADPSGTISIQGIGPVAPGATSAPVPLQPGHNTVTIQVTSADGQQTATYTLDVLRGNTDALLTNLTLSSGGLSPAFDAAVQSYSATVPYVMSSVRVGLALADTEATARVGARALRSGHAVAVALAPGLNTVPVSVTSSDGTVQRTYQLRITREAPQAVSMAGNPPNFAPPQNLPLAGEFLGAIAADDVDGDGQTDALALEYMRTDLSLIRGRGDGSMEPVQRLPLGIASPLRLAVGDVDGDGWPDVITVGRDQARLAVGTGTALGTAGLALQPLALSTTLRNDAPTVLLDVDGDGRDDIVSAQWDGVLVLRSLGDGRFGPPQALGTVARVQHVQGHDLNGDGHLDLVLANEDGALQVLPSLGGGAFGTPQNLSLGTTGQLRLLAPLRVADVNRDGRPDLIVAAQSNLASAVFVFLGQPGGGLGSPVRYHSGWRTYIGDESPVDLAVADFNGDGHPDIAVLNSNGGLNNVSILAGQGDGTFAAPVAHRVDAAPRRMAVADFDGDGKLDLLLDATMGAGGGLRLLRNTTPDLAQVVPSTGTLSPAFSGAVTDYTLDLPDGATDVTLTPWLAFGNGTVRVGGVPLASGVASVPIPVPADGRLPITIEARAFDGSTRTYTVSATRAVPITATITPEVGGTATCVPSLAARGSTPICTAVADARYEFAGWTGGCAGQGAICQLVNVREAQASVAQFTQRLTLQMPQGPQGPQPWTLGLSVPAGNGWEVLIAAPRAAADMGEPPPTGVTLPYGLLELRLQRGTPGSQATLVLTYPEPLPPGAVYYKFGRTADDQRPHWYPFPGAHISGNTVTLTLQDGGLGDDDLTPNGVIYDPGGVALLAAPAPAAATAIPTLHPAGLLALSLLAALMAWPRLRRPVRSHH